VCGICGVVRFAGPLVGNAERGCVASMMAVLAHRGPDGEGVHESERAMIGATRLAIRGLLDGTQPIVDAATGVVAVCNGEIDNHDELRSFLADRGVTVEQETDVAVLPALYLALGDTMVERLRGAFAIAIWDPRHDRLVLARDRAGERPLFFEASESGVRFASVLSALAIAREEMLEPAVSALHDFVQLGVFRAPHTPFRGVEKVAPGEVVVIDPSGARRRRYWRWEIATTPKRTPSVGAFDAVFRGALTTQTNIDADVDYGVFLSGGLDSSLVAAVARAVRPERKIRAYVVRFDEPSYDEGRFAEEVARDLSIEWISVSMRSEDVPREIGELVRRVGEPLADPAWLPAALLARRAGRDVKMALVGEGADELFGGYPTYLGAGIAQRYRTLPRAVRQVVKRLVEKLPATEKKVALSFLLKRFVAAEGLDGLGRHVFWASQVPASLMNRLGVDPREIPEPRSGTFLDVAQTWDLENTLAEGLLTKADRASMLSGLELRAPFLDQGVMEFARSLPDNERVSGLTTKVFLKRYARGYLSRRIVQRRKRGLSVPLTGWLRRPLFVWAKARLECGQLDRVGIATKAALEMLQDHRTGVADHARILWTLLVLIEWLDYAANPGIEALRLPDATAVRAQRSAVGRISAPT